MNSTKPLITCYSAVLLEVAKMLLSNTVKYCVLADGLCAIVGRTSDASLCANVVNTKKSEQLIEIPWDFGNG